MNKSGYDTGELYVYECRGLGYPMEEPSFEGFLGIWPEPPFYYIFSGRQALAGIQRWVGEQKGWLLRDTYRLDYDQWQQVSTVQHRVGPFVIDTTPSDEDEAASGADIHIHIDPGVVFGSGLHPTTRGCLMVLADLVSRFPIRIAIDLGTGTGILAIACARLGVPAVMALDCNFLAVRVARRNVRLNRRSEAVHLLVADGLEVLSGPADLLIMNIEWPCLKKVLQGREWMNHHRVILSGFLQSQWDELKALLPREVRVLQREVLDDWVTAVVAREE